MSIKIFSSVLSKICTVMFLKNISKRQSSYATTDNYSSSVNNKIFSSKRSNSQKIVRFTNEKKLLNNFMKKKYSAHFNGKSVKYNSKNGFSNKKVNKGLKVNVKNTFSMLFNKLGLLNSFSKSKISNKKNTAENFFYKKKTKFSNTVFKPQEKNNEKIIVKERQLLFLKELFSKNFTFLNSASSFGHLRMLSTFLLLLCLTFVLVATYYVAETERVKKNVENAYVLKKDTFQKLNELKNNTLANNDFWQTLQNYPFEKMLAKEIVVVKVVDEKKFLKENLQANAKN